MFCVCCQTQKKKREMNMVLLLLAVSFLLQLSVGYTGGPSGTYCGTYMMMTKGTVTIHAAERTFDLTVSAFGSNYECHGTKYRLLGENSLDVPDASDPNTCIGGMVKSNGISLNVYYHGDEQVTLDLGIASITMEHC